jgi:two-component system phosphate regulon sensor histidine kinase PhoR
MRGWRSRLASLRRLVGAASASEAGSAPDARGGRTSERLSRLGRISAADLAEVVPDPLILFDRSGAVVHVNEAATAAFGAIVPGSSVQMKFRAPEMQALVAETLSGQGEASPIDYSERLPVERVYRVVARPVGRSTGLFAMIFRDHSEARRIDRMRADFIANASHELRTPLASIAGFIDTLRGPAKNDVKAREHFLRIMESQTARMARLIDDLLSLSRLEMKSHRRLADKVDIVSLVDGVIDTLGHLAAETDVSIERDFPDRAVVVTGDRDELVQVFLNLIENACKYGRSGKRVIVSIAQKSDGPEVTVKDFGPGIPKEDIPRITERFYRVDIEASREQKGTGLGLSIVRHILNRHGARLVIHSQLGQGASFSVRFPATG